MRRLIRLRERALWLKSAEGPYQARQQVSRPSLLRSPLELRVDPLDRVSKVRIGADVMTLIRVGHEHQILVAVLGDDVFQDGLALRGRDAGVDPTPQP